MDFLKRLNSILEIEYKVSLEGIFKTYIIRYCNSASGDMSKSKRDSLKINLYAHVCGSIVCSNRKVETDQVSPDGETDRQKTVRSYHGLLLLSFKKGPSHILVNLE